MLDELLDELTEIPARRCLRRWSGAVLAIGMIGAVLAGSPVAAMAPVRSLLGLPAATTPAQARAEVEAAETALGAANDRMVVARGEANRLESRIDEVSSERRLSLRQYEDLLANSRSVAVDAYMKGASSEDLAAMFDVDTATELAVRRHLTDGRVGRAADLAELLVDLRTDLDADVVELIAEADGAREALRIAEEELVAARERVDEAYLDLERADAAAAAAARAAREAEEREVAERARAEVAARDAAASARDTTAVAGPTAADSASGSSTGSGGYDGPTVTLDEAWAYLRDCESGGNYQIVDASGTYFGAYQFDLRTWAGVGGSGNPADASPEEQDYRAWLLYQQRGSAPWPHCGRYLP